MIFLSNHGTISIGFLNQSSHLLKIISVNKMIDLRRLNGLVSEDRIVFRNQGSNIIENALNNRWISVNGEGEIVIRRTLECYLENDLGAQREMLWLFIKESRPSWIRKLVHGIKEAKIGIYDSDTQQVFSELGLFGSYDDIEVKKWWNKVSKFCRDIKNERLSEIGMKGELLTLEYEKSRTGFSPIHSAMESDDYGYDVKSQISSEDKSDLYIEVKSTVQSLNFARFYLTKNEVKSCISLSPNYRLYLWNIADNKYRLNIISPSDFINHLPTNNESGEWEIASLSFDLFDWSNSKEWG